MKRSRSRSFEKKKGSKQRSSSASSDDKKKKKSKKDSKELKKLKWVIPGIIVRVISKKVCEGKLYNKKVKITDVLSAY